MRGSWAMLVASFRRFRCRAGDAVWVAGDPVRRAMRSARHRRTVPVLVMLPFGLLAAGAALFFPVAQGERSPAPDAGRVSGETWSSQAIADEDTARPRAKARAGRDRRPPAPAPVEAPAAAAPARPADPSVAAGDPSEDVRPPSPQRTRREEPRPAPRLLLSEGDRAPQPAPPNRGTNGPRAPTPETPETTSPSPGPPPEAPELPPPSDVPEVTTPDGGAEADEEDTEPDGGTAPDESTDPDGGDGDR